MIVSTAVFDTATCSATARVLMPDSYSRTISSFSACRILRLRSGAGSGDRTEGAPSGRRMFSLISASTTRSEVLLAETAGRASSYVSSSRQHSAAVFPAPPGFGSRGKSRGRGRIWTGRERRGDSAPPDLWVKDPVRSRPRPPEKQARVWPPGSNENGRPSSQPPVNPAGRRRRPTSPRRASSGGARRCLAGRPRA